MFLVGGAWLRGGASFSLEARLNGIPGTRVLIPVTAKLVFDGEKFIVDVDHKTDEEAGIFINHGKWDPTRTDDVWRISSNSVGFYVGCRLIDPLSSPPPPSYEELLATYGKADYVPLHRGDGGLGDIINTVLEELAGQIDFYEPPSDEPPQGSGEGRPIEFGSSRATAIVIDSDDE